MPRLQPHLPSDNLATHLMQFTAHTNETCHSMLSGDSTSGSRWDAGQVAGISGDAAVLPPPLEVKDLRISMTVVTAC